MFWRITTSSLTDKLSNKFLVPPLIPSFHHLTRICLWIKLKLIIWKPKYYSLWCGLDILTIFSLSGHMVSKNSELFCVAFMISILTKNSYELSKESIVFVDLKISVKNRLLQIWMWDLLIAINISINCLLTQTTLSDLQSLARLCVLVGCALMRKTL